MTYEMKPFKALPCELEVFTINGKPAYKYDFGNNNDHREEVDLDDFENADDLLAWGCCNNYFTPDIELKESAMEKYNLTENEYEEICEELKHKLYVGQCGWCI